MFDRLFLSGVLITIAAVLVFFSSAVCTRLTSDSIAEPDSYSRIETLLDSLRSWTVATPVIDECDSILSESELMMALEPFPHEMQTENDSSTTLIINYPIYENMLKTTMRFSVVSSPSYEFHWLSNYDKNLSDSKTDTMISKLIDTRYQMYRTLPLHPAFQPVLSSDSVIVPIVIHWRQMDTVTYNSVSQVIEILRSISRDLWVYAVLTSVSSDSAVPSITPDKIGINREIVKMTWSILITAPSARGNHFIEVTEAFNLKNNASIPEFMSVHLYPFIPTENVSELFATPAVSGQRDSIPIHLNR
ncbi:MAG: hypothetical protein U9N55_00045 [candidate division Zixibacteria bacterium]|nr:hypothetical protein [candidate division Zixibacteria bacterium]